MQHALQRRLVHQQARQGRARPAVLALDLDREAVKIAAPLFAEQALNLDLVDRGLVQ